MKRHLVTLMAGAFLMIAGPGLHAEVIADSAEEYSDTQGKDNWFHGYRNLGADPESAPINYDPNKDFIAFPADWWRGAQWDEPNDDGDNKPWTELGRTTTHPNGVNSGGEEHWTIRRWVSTELKSLTPLAITWSVEKTNKNCGNGVTGAVHFNGKRIDARAIDNQDEPQERTVYVNAAPGDKLDLILSPVGPDEGNGDGCDGSANWMKVDTTIPANPKQPDGSNFLPGVAADADGDGMADEWEKSFTQNTTTFTTTTDFDKDGLKDVDEFKRSTDPTKPDTDGDGLNDAAETETGKFVSATDAGTNAKKKDSDNDGLTDGAEVNGKPASDPTKTDTDGDSYKDGAEVASGFNPSDAKDNPENGLIADSMADFTTEGVQNDKKGWFYGYRDLTKDKKGEGNYDPVKDFVPFPPEWWAGSKWDEPNEDGNNMPWTELAAEATHPNGPNSGNQLHWVTRRWVAETPQALALTWFMRKTNVNCGNGVTGYLYINGQKVDSKAIAGNDGEGVVRTYFANLKKSDIVDLQLGPRGPDNSDNDGCDGSAYRLIVATGVPALAKQPDGTIFVAPTATDSDKDGLPDAWEKQFGDDLAKLSGTADFDKDGLTDKGEFDLLGDPTKPDTDGDTLRDGVETGTGKFVDANNTGTSPAKSDTDGDGLADNVEIATAKTDPNKADTDGDGYSDKEEIDKGNNPNDAKDNPGATILADSAAGFSNTQGKDNWFFGYRNVTEDGKDIDYDPTKDFKPFPKEWWTGAQWDEPNEDGDNMPWTELGATTTHPNGSNSGGEEHWVIRRWKSTKNTAAAITWNVRKTNTGCGNGVTGAVHINGKLIDTKTIAGNDGKGVTRTVYANLKTGDFVDLILSPRGMDETDNDGCDGSAYGMIIDSKIPANPVQPDGKPFVPGSGGGAGKLDVRVKLETAAGAVKLSFPPAAGKTYGIEYSEDLKTWKAVGNATAGAFEDKDAARVGKKAGFYRVGTSG